MKKPLSAKLVIRNDDGKPAEFDITKDGVEIAVMNYPYITSAIKPRDMRLLASWLRKWAKKLEKGEWQ